MCKRSVKVMTHPVRMIGMLTRLASAFARRQDGNSATWFAILLVPLLGFTFGAVQYAEMSRYRSDLIEALDAAALAVARRADQLGIDACDLAPGSDGTIPLKDEYDELIEYGQEFYARNFPNYDKLYGDRALTKKFDPTKDLKFDINCVTVQPSATAFMDMGPVIGGLFNQPEVQVGTATEISLPGSGRIELALVLDVTGSMDSCASTSGGYCSGSSTRMGVLKSAIETMMDNLYGTSTTAENEFVRVGIVPFSSTVNINPEHFFWDAGGNVTATGKQWMDTEGGAVWHGSNFMHIEYDDSSGASNSGNWFDIDIDRKVNHFDLFNSIDETYAEWKGCVEARPFPLDETDDEPGTLFTQAKYNLARQKPSGFSVPSDTASATKTRINTAWNEIPEKSDEYTFTELAEADSTRFVPWFYPDEPDCNDDACGGFSSQWGWQRDFAANSGDSNFPNYMVDGPKSAFGDYENSYKNRSFVRDYKYVNVREGIRDSSEVYRNLMMHYRSVYARNFYVSGDSTTGGGLTQCSQSNNTWGYDADNAQGMIDAINKFKAYRCTEREYHIRQAYVGIWDDSTDTYWGKYDDVNGYTSSSDNPSGATEIAGTGPNRGCSTALLPLTTKKKEIIDKMTELDPGGTTNTSIGAIWGWRILSPDAPFTEGSDPETTDGKRWRKFMVLMTDGRNNMGASSTHNLSDYSPYGYMAQDRLNVLPSSVTSPSSADNYYEDEFDNKTIRICHRARASGIKVFAIGFAIHSGSSVEKMLQACAVDEDAYFLAQDADALHEAFGKITDQIVELHVSG